MKIQSLSPDVVDQIAAGEVVERPAHLVKELVENSLDAGATQIEIEVNEGGRFVHLSDNGRGIPEGELSLALARHATSKIQNTSDLWSLKSFGFRGEALASISSVSRLSLTSKPEGQSKAFKLESEFGQVSSPSPSGGGQGTRIQVKDLFSNVPARLKFLKSEAAELSQVKNVLKALAMSNPQVQFKIKSQSKILYFWPACEHVSERVQQVLEQKEMFYGEIEIGTYKARVVLGSPKNVLRQSRQMWIFVQGRWVQDRSLQAAVMEGYRNLLMHGEFPIAAVFVECDPEDIDVNIHPTKSLVKFREPNKAFKVTVEAVRKVLSESPWVPSSTTASDFKMRVETLPSESLKFSDGALERVQYSKKSFHTPEKAPSPFQVRETLKMYSPTPSRETPPPAPEIEVESPSAGSSKKFWSRLHVLGQAHLTYILAQDADKLYLIDQHAAHERVAFESLMAAWQGGRIDVQSFLVPLVLDFEAPHVEALVSLVEDFKKLGVSLDAMGPESIAVSAAPSLLSEKALSKALDLAGREVLEKGGSFALEKLVADLCATMACHSVIRAGQALSVEEMQALLQQMDEFPFSSFCPHGRPVSVEYSFARIEKEFGRIV